MQVKRIVTNINATRPEQARAFYVDALGLDVAMDMGWIMTVQAQTDAAPQISIASEGGAGTAVPDLSIEVDDLDEALSRMQAGGFDIEYGPVNEPWGVRRFYVRDPFGRLVNIMVHD